MRTNANSIANLSYNLFGYVPAPYIYGWAYESTGAGNSHAGLIVIQSFTISAYIFLLILYYRKNAQFYRMMAEVDVNSEKSEQGP